MPAKNQPSEKGVLKFADDFILGVVGFVYSVILTAWVLLRRPLWGPVSLRVSRKGGIPTLSSPMALFLTLVAMVLLFDPLGFNWTNSGSLEVFLHIEDAQWYEQLLVVGSLYISIDVLIALLCKAFSGGRRKFRRNLDLIRYAISLSILFVILGKISTRIYISLQNQFSDDNLLNNFPGNLSIVILLTFILLFFYPASAMIAAVINSSRPCSGITAKTLLSIISIVLMLMGSLAVISTEYIILFALIGPASSTLADQAKEKDIILNQSLYNDSHFENLDVSDIICLIAAPAKIMVTVAVKNRYTPLLIAPLDKFYVSISDPNKAGELVRVNLAIEGANAVLIPNTNTVPVTWVGDFNATTLQWQADRQLVCRLSRLLKHGGRTHDHITLGAGRLKWIDKDYP